MAVATFTKSGSKASTAAKLPKNIFNEAPKTHDLIKQVFVAQHAAKRANTATTLKRGEVRGGGRKPWRQKGTGRARHGSIRSPIWRGGGITFGPTTDKNYQKKLPKAAKQKALRQLLTIMAANDGLSVIDDFEVKDGKTATAAGLLQKLALPKPLLLVDKEFDENTKRALRNLPDTETVTSTYLSVYRLANARHVIFTKDALKEVEAWLTPGEKSREGVDDVK